MPQVELVIRTLCVRQDVEMFHHNCYDEAPRIAKTIDVDIKRPRVFGRQVHWENYSLISGLSEEQTTEDYFHINVTIPILDDVLWSLQTRFEEEQENVMKGTTLLPSCNIYESELTETVRTVDGFMQYNVDKIPLVIP